MFRKKQVNGRLTTAFTGLRPVEERKAKNPRAETPVQRLVIAHSITASLCVLQSEVGHSRIARTRPNGYRTRNLLLNHPCRVLVMRKRSAACTNTIFTRPRNRSCRALQIKKRSMTFTSTIVTRPRNRPCRALQMRKRSAMTADRKPPKQPHAVADFVSFAITTAFTGLRPADARKTENPPAATPVQRFVMPYL